MNTDTRIHAVGVPDGGYVAEVLQYSVSYIFSGTIEANLQFYKIDFYRYPTMNYKQES